MSKYLSSQAALSELGYRLKTYRVHNSLTQDDLARISGISRRGIQYMENGKDVKFSTIVKVLMALGLDSNLDILVPDSTRRPSYYLKENANSKRYLRANKKKVLVVDKEFKWGDDQR